ncbi:MAG: transglycosylase domain-containing protein [Berryella intestinalis]|uniref:transglycosylase domain-containing protein n=1 Tax=Berryella intestinalis TaxID=1531429 RepID=UPI002A592C64|nr:transglycosylase domain-containing protein [Berryella intestinalis]MDD7369878.1 transglycosylase domain-containing protein [Berryella intestinalis]MDY3128785.1 transglycosylase domain-containing protein [Berryella intestinalis]
MKKRRPLVGFLYVFGVLFALLVAGALAGFALISTWTSDLPDCSGLEDIQASKPTVVYASDGTTQLARFQLENRTPIDAARISKYVLNGTVDTEDERFYQHNGIDMAGIARAMVNNLTGGELEGASTITQQLVRNTVIADEMNDISIKRKVREAALSLQMERLYTKGQILVMYLNTINYGSGAYGIEAASQRYFSKSASDLTLAEAALLVGVPQSPTYNNPLQYPDNAVARRNLVLSRMLKAGDITQEEHDQAVAEPLALNPSEPADDIQAYPFFTTYVRSLITSQYGISESDIMEGGLTVVTTLDPKLQDAAEYAAQQKRQKVGGSFDVAMTVIDPDTGYIKAIVGGADYYTSQVNIATGQGTSGRPCGSAFKVFTLVAALEQGISPQTLVDCTSPATIDGYTLQNYDNINYGTRSISRALAVSANTGFVRLAASMGPQVVADTATKMGIDSALDVKTTGETITLGVENVTPLEMTEAYATIAAGGMHRDPTAIMTISDSDGRIVVDNTDIAKRSKRVISEEVAYAAEQAMEGVVNSYEGTGTAARLSNGQTVAGKTGTTENYKDVSFYGITPQYAVGIWCGDPSNKASLTPGTVVTDVFASFMNVALKGQPTETFKKQKEPTYKPYSDEKYHIYGVGGYSTSSGSGSGSGSAGASSDSSSQNQSGTTAENANQSGSSGNGTGGTTGSGSTGTGTSEGGSGNGGAATGGQTGTSTGGGASSGGTSGGSGSSGGTAATP